MPSISVQYPSSMLYISTLIEIFFVFTGGPLIHSRQFYNGKDRALKSKDRFVTVKMLL